jgi:DNA (cytosine-5)-methyltransferase 1
MSSLEQMSPSKKQQEFVSLFAGAGGLDLGLEQAGWDCLYAVDNDSDAVKTLKANQGKFFGKKAIFECSDVRELTGQDILRKVNRSKGEVPLMAGGPPCQSWSSAGKQKGFDDPRGQLFSDFVRLADECGCQMIVFENVRGMLTARGPQGEPGEALQIIRESLWERGYRSEVSLLNAADYGIPQRRVRLIIIGYRGTAKPTFPTPKYGNQEPSTLSLLLPWKSLSSVLIKPDALKPEEFITPTGKMAQRLKGLKPGQGAKSAGKKETTRPGGHWGYLQGGFVADPQLPARTVTASSQQDWIMLPDGSHRRLCPRECAAIQTFPQDWTFCGKPSSQYKQIGNAVPPLFAKHLGTSLLALLNSEPDPAPFEFPLPQSLRSAIRYTKKEHSRNGASRKSAVKIPIKSSNLR